MEKLKIYSAYLPYGLKLKYFDDEREILHNDCKIVEFREDEMTIANNEYQYDVKFDDVKPIMFSLEDLTKEIAVNGKIFVPIEYHAFKHNKEHLIDFQNNFAHYKSVKYGIIEKLLEWKFNVFNLPEDKYEKVTEDFNPYK